MCGSPSRHQMRKLHNAVALDAMLVSRNLCVDVGDVHGRVLVRGVVVGDQMQRLVLGRLAVDLPEELQPLGVGVACWH